MAVNVKMGVDIGGFTSGIKQGQQILKGLNAELKASESEFKATGNAEQKLASQTKTLTSQLNVQKGIADQARAALKAMTDAGVDPTDAAYQRLYVTLMNAEAGANDALAALNALKGGTEGAAKGAEELTNGLNNIGKKMSLEQVKNGISSITTGLENAAKKAVQLGEQLWNTIMDSAKRADDTATMAEMYGIDLDTFMRMQKLVENGLDTSVESILASQKKLKKGIGKESKETAEALKELGLAFSTDRGGWIAGKDSLDLMFRAGQALKKLSSETEREAKAQAIFGRSWEELVPLFNQYQTVDEYREALAGVTVNSEDTIRDLAALNDAVSALESSWTTLKDELIGAIAPALTKGADAISGLLDKLTEYLKTDEGQEMLEKLGTAVSGLFDDLGKIDPEQVVEGFTGVITSVTTGVQWLVDNVETVKGILGVIVGAWVASNATIAGLEIMKLIQGIQGLTGAGAAAAAGQAGTAVGASWGAGFASAVLKAAPWLTFLYTLFNPAGSAGDNIDVMYDENGNLTKAGLEAGMPSTQQQDEEEEAARRENRKRTEEIQKRNEQKLNFRRIEHDLLEEEKKSAEIDKGLTDLISQRNERKTTWNPLLSAGIGEDLLPEEAQYWLRGMYAPWSQFTDKDFNMTDILMPWKGVAKLLSQNLPSENQPIIDVPVNPEADPNAAGEIAEQVGPVEIPVQLTVKSITTGGGFSGFANYFDNLSNLFGRGYANGLPNVPNDGLYRLHKGERVVPARAVSSQNYNSNLYVESMYMNSGMDAAGLASAMAAAQRRQMSGYGS